MIDCERYWTILQKIQCKTSTNVLWFGECLCLRHLEASVFMGKNHSENLHSVKNTGNDFTLKQVFEISEKLIWNNQMGFLECLKSAGKILHGNNYLWLVMKKSSVSRMQRFMYSQILCYVLERWIRNPASNTVWEEPLSWFKVSPQYRTLDTIDGEPMEFEWNIFPGFTTIQLINKVQKFMNKMGDPAQFQGRIIFMSMFNGIIWWTKDNEQECIANATLVSVFAKSFPPGRWSFLGPGSEIQWYSTYNERLRGEWDRVAELMMITLAESGHPVFRATSSLSRGTLRKAKEAENYLYTSVPMVIRLRRFFAQLFLLIS